MSNPNQFTTPFAITKVVHRDPYPAISPERPENSQSGKVIIITGGGSGIGAAAAKVWARAGAQGIVILGRRQDKLDEVSAAIKAISAITTVLAVATDVTIESDVENLYAQVQKTFGRQADVLLNNAGFLDDEKGRIGEQSVEDWWKVQTVNLKGSYTMTHHFIRTQKDPINPTGTVINVASGRAGLTTVGGSAYNVAKLAEQRLSEHIHLEYPSLNIYTTMPGIVLTGIISEFWLPFAKDHVDLTGMLALYLSQPRAHFLSGMMISVNWDVDELEQHKAEIVEKKLLETSWLPILPVAGGKGL